MNTKIKIILQYCKKAEEIEREVNDFCKGKDIISIQATDIKIFITYRDRDKE